jgi:hypothetical protein
LSAKSTPLLPFPHYGERDMILEIVSLSKMVDETFPLKPIVMHCEIMMNVINCDCGREIGLV